MQNAKLGLSPEELSLVMDPGIILTKNAIIEKVCELFGVLAEEQKQISWPEEARAVAPKISKGENYKGLPYVVLDFPRLFTSDHVLAMRTHFWWGNYFSVTLHLKGQYCKMKQERLMEGFEMLAETGHLLCVDEDEWQHEIREPFYIQLRSMGYEKYQHSITSSSFIKIAKPFPLQEWNHISGLLKEEQQILAKLL